MVNNHPVGIIVFSKSGKILFGRRTDGKGWAFPGGKTEPGEKPINAAVRELREETDVDAKTIDVHFIGSCQVFDELDGVKTHMIADLFYYGKHIDPSECKTSDELDDYVWMEPRKALDILPLFMPTEQSLRFFLGKIMRVSDWFEKGITADSLLGKYSYFANKSRDPA